MTRLSLTICAALLSGCFSDPPSVGDPSATEDSNVVATGGDDSAGTDESSSSPAVETTSDGATDGDGEATSTSGEVEPLFGAFYDFVCQGTWQAVNEIGGSSPVDCEGSPSPGAGGVRTYDVFPGPIDLLEVVQVEIPNSSNASMRGVFTVGPALAELAAPRFSGSAICLRPTQPELCALVVGLFFVTDTTKDLIREFLVADSKAQVPVGPPLVDFDISFGGPLEEGGRFMIEVRKMGPASDEPESVGFVNTGIYEGG